MSPRDARAALEASVLAAARRLAPEADVAAIDRRRPLAEQLDLDSIDGQALLAALAAEHAVAFPEDVVPTLRSVDELVAFLVAAGAGAGVSP